MQRLATQTGWDADDFLKWAEGREGHFELVHGEIVEMRGGTLGHFRLAHRLAVTLSRLLDSSAYDVVSLGFGVRTFAGNLPGR